MLALRLCYLAGFEQVCRLMQAEHKKQKNKNNNNFKKKEPISYTDVIVALSECLLLYDISPPMTSGKISWVGSVVS